MNVIPIPGSGTTPGHIEIHPIADTVTISLVVYHELLDAARDLLAMARWIDTLETAGVAYWEGYDHACQIYDQSIDE